MLNRKQEYEKMAEVEMDHWWYQTLHKKVFDVFKFMHYTKDISVLDAGCGTGGLLMKMQMSGYSNIFGFDVSNDAVSYCTEHGLIVKSCNLVDVKDAFPEKNFDVIISNDTMYFLEMNQIINFISDCNEILNTGGVIICNMPALKKFSGIHDISVGIKHRFSKKDIAKYFNNESFAIVEETYWPLLLSPVILLVRTIQRIKIKLSSDIKIKSDIGMPLNWINNILIKICVWDVSHLKYYSAPTN